MKKVAVFHPSSELYGADRILVLALKALPQSVEKVVYLRVPGPLVEFMKKEVSNVEVVLVPELPIIYRKIFTPLGVLAFIGQLFGFFKFLKSEKKKHQFGSAYINTLSCSFILPLCSFLKIPNLVHVHEIIEKPKLVAKLTAWLALKFSDKVVAVSQAVKDNLVLNSSRLEEKTVVLHNGIPEVLCNQMPQREKLNFYLFGRLMPKKGQWYLLEALERIPKSILRNTQFTLMGGVLEGNEHLQDDLEEKIASLGMEELVKLKPFAPNIALAMEEADVCLVPSKMRDPFPYNGSRSHVSWKAGNCYQPWRCERSHT